MSTPVLFEPPPELEGDRPESSFARDVALARRAEEGAPESAAFLNSPEGRRLLRRLQDSQKLRRRQRWIAAAGALAAGVAAIALGYAFWPDGAVKGTAATARHGIHGGYTGIKGGSSLMIFRKRGKGSVQLRDGAALQAGDRLRFVYRTAYPYIMVVNIEARGKVQPFYPHPAGSSMATVTGKQVRLKGSIELDESTGLERIAAIFSKRPLAFNQVRLALLAAYPKRGRQRMLINKRPVDLPGEVRSYLIVKEGRGKR